MRWVIGAAFICVAGPAIAPVGLGAVVWYYIDPVTPFLCKKLTETMSPFSTLLTRKAIDRFLVPFAILQGVIVPALFFYNMWYTVTHGFSPYMAYAYHVIRVGPYFQNFAYSYTLCHKEGHTKQVGMFKREYQRWFGNIWNWWIGVFYGVMPSTFAYGHTVNHHRYDNDEYDNVSTWDQPRDDVMHYIAYLPRWLAYHMNMSVFIQFCLEGETKLALWMVFGTSYYLLVFSAIWWVSPIFALVYFIYPLLESAFLLSAINWAWHCFVDPDADNFYAYSVTIFDSFEFSNILNEDYHVVHHQYPAVHWSDHPRLFEKHKEEYIAKQATIFKNTHAMEIFFLAILRQYDQFAAKFIDLKDELTLEQKRRLIQTRLQTCTWGANANTIQAKAAKATAVAAEGKKTK